MDAASLPEELLSLDAGSVDGVLVLVDADAPVEGLNEAARAASVPAVGGLFPGVVHEGDSLDAGAVVVELPAEPRVTTVTSLSAPAPELMSQLRPGTHDERHGTAMVFVDAHADRVGEFVRRLFDVYGVELDFLGGGAGVLDQPGQCVLTPRGLREDAAVVAMLPVSSSIGVKHGWQTADGPFRVTNSTGRTVAELDGRPAFEVYRSAVDSEIDGALTRETFPETASAFPFGLRRMNEETVVRDPYKMDERGTITCFGPVPEGEFVHVLTGDADSLVEAASDAVATVDEPTTAPENELLALFDCVSRALYLDDEFERELTTVGTSDQPAFGAFTIGEIANGSNGHLEYYNKTAVVARITQR